MLGREPLTAQRDDLSIEYHGVTGLPKQAKKARKLCVVVQRLKEEQTKSFSPSYPLRKKEWLVNLVAAPAQALKKVAKVKGRVKKLDTDGQKSVLQRASVEGMCRELKEESVDAKSKQ